MNKIDTLIHLNEKANRENNYLQSSLGLHHSFSRNRVLSDFECSELLNRYGVKIPQEYGEYIKKVGNGGDQPLSGMFEFEKSLIINSGNNNQAIQYFSDELFADFWFLEMDESVFTSSEVSTDSCNNPCESNRTFDDYYNGDSLMNYNTDLFVFNRKLLKHVLVFSYLPETNLQCFLVLDGMYEGNVMYYNSRNKRIINTHCEFLDWWIGYYNHILNCNPVYKYIYI